eukprot:1037927-Pleurochrysis_carterae.AAC.2
MGSGWLGCGVISGYVAVSEFPGVPCVTLIDHKSELSSSSTRPLVLHGSFRRCAKAHSNMGLGKQQLPSELQHLVEKNSKDLGARDAKTFMFVDNNACA